MTTYLTCTSLRCILEDLFSYHPGQEHNEDPSEKLQERHSVMLYEICLEITDIGLPTLTTMSCRSHIHPITLLRSLCR